MNTRPPAAVPPSKRKRLILFAKLILAIVVAIALTYAAAESVEQWRSEQQRIESEIQNLRQQQSEITSERGRRERQRQIDRLDASVPRLSNLNWSLLGLSAILYAAGLIPNALLLRRALLALGQHPSRRTAIAAHLLGHVGKYVPGKAMVVVLRVGALRRDQVATVPATISIFMETFLMMAVGGAVAGAIVVWLPVPAWIAIASVAMAVIASLPTLPPVLRLAAAKVSHLQSIADDPRIGTRLFIAGWGWSLLAWLLIGASFTAIVLAIPTIRTVPPLAEVYAISTAAIALAIVIGFASLLPGGAGIRELVLTTIYSVSLGTAHGLLAAVAARIVFLVVEAVMALASWWWLQNASERRQVFRES